MQICNLEIRKSQKLKKKSGEDAIGIEEENCRYKKGMISEVNKLKFLHLDTIFGD